MIARRFILAASVVALAAASAPASAQYYYGPGSGYGYGPQGYGPPPAYGAYNAPPPPVGREYGRGYQGDDFAPPRAPRPLSARAIVDHLEDMGYEDVGQPRFTGNLYVVRATGPGGVRQQIVIDAFRGTITNRAIVSPDPAYAPPEPRRYGGRPLDTDDLYGPPPEEAPRRAPRRRDTARSGPIESSPSREPGSLPLPADPRLAPSDSPAPRTNPRPAEGRAGGRQATRGDVRTDPPKETGARPFGLNPVQPTPKPTEGEQRKAAQPPERKKPVAEARPAPDRPVRVIQGVTPLTNGESRQAAEAPGQTQP